MAKKKSFKGKQAGKSFQRKSQLQTSGGGSGYRFLNPYNFVRFLGKGREDSSDPEVTLLGRCAPPPHDRYVGISGRITCTLETMTPLFISDSEGVCEEPNDHKSYSFFQVNNQHAIPATSLRGMVRTVFEAVTNSCMALFEGARQSYHLDSRLAPQLVPARVERGENGWRLRLLTGTTSLSVAASPRGPQYAAWVHRYWPMKPSGTLRQNPPQNDRVKQFQERTAPGNEVDLQGLNHPQECYALLRLMQHPHPWIQFWDVVELDTDRQRLEQRKRGKQRVEKGWLCVTNQNIEPKHSERFFFRAAENNDHPETIELPESVRKQYEDLIRDYQERHQKTVKQRRDRNQPLHSPVGDDPGLSRFIYTQAERKLKGGELVYAMLEGTDEHPVVKFIVPVSVPRVAYENSMADLLSRNDGHLAPCSDYRQLCPACRVFGWVHQQAPEDPSVRVAYGGRVAFSHAILRSEPKKIAGSISLAILSSPKPTTIRFYLMPQNGIVPEPWTSQDAERGYDGNNTLRGRKLYRHHGKANPEEYKRAGDRKDGQNRTVRDVLDSGNKFTFTVHFENLAPVELGALLWALELENGWVHRLGFAKPLGFGSVKVSVNTVEVLNPRERYASLTTNGWYNVEPKLWQQQCLEKFKTAMQRRYNKVFDELKNVQDLKALLGTAPTIAVHYPRPPYNGTSEPDPEGKQYEWFIGNKKRKLALKLAPEDTEGLSLINRDGNEF